MADRTQQAEEAVIVRLLKQEKDSNPDGTQAIAHKLLQDELNSLKPETLKSVIEDMKKTYSSSLFNKKLWTEGIGDIQDIRDAAGNIIAIDFTLSNGHSLMKIER
jgi:hypothetical protein